MEDYCNNELQHLFIPDGYFSSAIILKTSRDFYQLNSTCTLKLAVPFGNGILIAVDEVDLAEYDNLTIINSPTVETFITENKKYNQNMYFSTNNGDNKTIVELRSSGYNTNHIGFTFYITCFKCKFFEL